MRFSSPDAPKREGWVEVAPGVSVPDNARPSINANHIDGPVLHMRSGEMHWLTMWERFQLWRGKADAYSLEHKRRPHLRAAFATAGKSADRTGLTVGTPLS